MATIMAVEYLLDPKSNLTLKDIDYESFRDARNEIRDKCRLGEKGSFDNLGSIER